MQQSEGTVSGFSLKPTAKPYIFSGAGPGGPKIVFHFTIKLQTQAALALSESKHLLKPMNHFLHGPPSPFSSRKVTLAECDVFYIYNVN